MYTELFKYLWWRNYFANILRSYDANAIQLKCFLIVSDHVRMNSADRKMIRIEKRLCILSNWTVVFTFNMENISLLKTATCFQIGSVIAVSYTHLTLCMFISVFFSVFYDLQNLKLRMLPHYWCNMWIW